MGDRVTAEQVVACGECLYCRKGRRWLCAPHDIFGFHTCVPGAMAEYMVLPAKALLHRVPNSLTPKEAVFIEPLRYAPMGGRGGRRWGCGGSSRAESWVGCCGPVGCPSLGSSFLAFSLVAHGPGQTRARARRCVSPWRAVG